MTKPKKQTRIGTNILHYLSGQAGIAVFNVITSAVLARYMSKDAFGTLSYLIALAAVVLPFADLGSTGLYMKEAARSREEIGAHWARSVALKVRGLAITVPLLGAYFYFFDRDFLQFYWLTFFYVFVQTMYLGTDIVFRAGELARGWTMRRLLYEFSYFLMTLATLGLFGLTKVIDQFWIVIIATTISLLWATVTIWRATALNWRIIWAEMRRPLRGPEITALWPFALNATLYIFYYRVTAVMLQKLGSASDVAEFRVTFVAVMAALYLPKAVSWAASPRLALYDEDGQRERFAQLLRQSADVNLIIACFVTLGGWLYGARLLDFAFGAKYSSMTELWGLMNITIGLFYVQQFCVDLLNFLKKERDVVRILLLGAAVLIFLNFLLIPKYGVMGAAAARVVAGVIMVPLSVYTLASLIGFQNLHGMNLWKFAAVNVAAGVLGFLLLKVNFWLSMGVFGISYIAMLVMFRVLPENIKQVGIKVALSLTGR